METLQDILELSRVIDKSEYWKPLNEYYNPLLGLNNDKEIFDEYKKWENESFKKCFKEKWGIEDIHTDSNFHLVLVIENERITKVGFTGCLCSWFGHFTMYKGCNNLRLYIKDLTEEEITYDNYRQYKKLYIEKFIVNNEK